MTEESQTLDQTLDQTLNKTDFGHVINENKKPILVAGVVFLLAIAAFSIYKNQSGKAYQTQLEQAFVFETEVLAAYNDGKIKTDDFLIKVKAMPSDIKGSNTLVPALFVSLDKLVEEGKTTEAIVILESWKPSFAKGTFMSYFIGLKLLPLLEDTNAYDKSIDLLTDLIASKIEISKGKMYLDLGRIYLKKGDKVKADENFQFVIDNHKDTEFAKLANLYLGK